MQNSKTAGTLARVERGDLCAGCGACAALVPNKVHMTTRAPGFARPVQKAPLEPSEDAQIAAVCPGNVQKVELGGRTPSVLWGPYVSAQTGWSTDAEIRFAGSSGGGLSAIALHLVQSGRVDQVIQTTQDPAFPIGNVPTLSDTPDAIIAAAGSRYAASSPLAALPDYIAQHKAQGTRYAFIGKPCDATALRAMMREDASLEQVFPVILSFFCAGVPSHDGGKAVLKALGTSLEDTEQFRFRGNGWPGKATATAKDGTQRSMSYHDSWGKILSRHVQHRCKICADGTGVDADVVCADFWESDAKGYPVFEEGDGVSLILARTALGHDIVGEMQAAKTLETQSCDIDDLVQIQPGQRERRKALAARLAAHRVIGRPTPKYVGMDIIASGRQNTVASNAKNFLGTLRRLIGPRKEP